MDKFTMKNGKIVTVNEAKKTPRKAKATRVAFLKKAQSSSVSQKDLDKAMDEERKRLEAEHNKALAAAVEKAKNDALKEANAKAGGNGNNKS